MQLKENFRPKKSIRSAVLAVVLVMALPCLVFGHDWNGVDGSWFDPKNWVQTSLPGAGDSSGISNGGTANISGGEAETLKLSIGYYRGTSGILKVTNGGKLTIGDRFSVGDYSGSSGAVTVAGPGSEVNTKNNMQIGWYGNGSLEVKDGAKVQMKWGTIGGSTGSTGAVTVAGPGSKLISTDYIYLGELGKGSLEVRDGAKATMLDRLFVGNGSGSSGMVTVAGFDSELNISSSVFLGLNGDGTLVVKDGGKVAVGGPYFMIGMQPGATGQVTVKGKGSTLSAREVLLGGHIFDYPNTIKGGKGEMTISDGGEVRFGNLFQIFDSSNLKIEKGGTLQIDGRIIVDGTATVSDQGSSLKVGNDLFVGKSGRGSLIVNKGGQAFVVGNFIINSDLEKEDQGVKVSEKESLIQVGGKLVVDGLLNVEKGGSFRVDGDAVIGSSSGSQGKATVSDQGSSLKVGNDLFVGKSGKGELNVQNGGSITWGGVAYIGADAGSQGKFSISGANTAVTTTNPVYVGDNGSGTLNIIDGGSIKAGNWIYVGNQPGSEGLVEISGTGSTLETNSISIGGVDQNGARGIVMVSDGGSLIFSDQAQIWKNGSLIIAEGGTSGIIPGARMTIMGGGELAVKSGGTFNIEKDGTLYIMEEGRAGFEDPLSVRGNILVNGTYSCPHTTFELGSLLTGNGLIYGDISMSGTLSPGQSIGALKMHSNYTHNPDGVMIVELDSEKGLSDLLSVGGTATLNGGTLRGVWLNKKHLRQGLGFLEANTIPGDFSRVEGETALIKATKRRTGDREVMEMAKLPYYALAANWNQDSMTRTLETISPGVASGDLYEILSNVDFMATNQEVQTAYEQMVPVIKTAWPEISFNIMHQIQQATSRYLRDGAGRDSLKTAEKRRVNFYAQALNGLLTRDKEAFSGYPGHSAKTAGVAIGGDVLIGSKTLLGFLGGYAGTSTNWDDRGGSSGSLAGVFGDFYGCYSPEQWQFFAQLGVGNNSYESKRRIVFPGVDRTAKGDTTGNLISGEVGLGYTLNVQKWQVIPRASLRYGVLMENGYSETGTEDLIMKFDDRTTKSLGTSLGILVSRPVEFSNGMHLKPGVSASWWHEYINDRVETTARFANTNPGFIVKGPEREVNLFELGLQVSMEFTKRLTGFLNFNSLFGSYSRDYSGMLGVSLNF